MIGRAGTGRSRQVTDPRHWHEPALGRVGQSPPWLGLLLAPHTGEAGTSPGASVDIAQGSGAAWREELDHRIPAGGGTHRSCRGLQRGCQ